MTKHFFKNINPIQRFVFAIQPGDSAKHASSQNFGVTML